MSFWRWAEYGPPLPDTARLTLGEGNTPVIRSRRIGPAAGLRNLYFKLEFTNPTGSYKDRFACAAVSHMLAADQTRCLATSSGNTGASLAAYCALAGIDCLIAVVETAPEGKLQQMLAFGAKLVRIRGFGLDPAVTAEVMATVQRLGQQPGAAMQISAYHFSPLGMSGVQSISYELAEQFPEGIDQVFCPAGGGGMTLAVARGFAELQRRQRIPSSPRVECVQPVGNDTIASALRHGQARAVTVTCTSQISGLQVPTVIDGDAVIAACRATGGTGHTVPDEATWAMQQRLAREEGIFCEPAAALPVAAVIQAAEAGSIAADATIVALIGGSAFKDPPSLQRMLAHRSCPLRSAAEFAEIASFRPSSSPEFPASRL